MVWESEVWVFDEEACRYINGANTYMLSHMTNKTKREEVIPATTTFNIIVWMRANLGVCDGWNTFITSRTGGTDRSN
jgi:hypothetical protein